MDGQVGFPIKIVVPEIEDLMRTDGVRLAEKVLLERLGEDYAHDTADKESRSWYGRCVYEAGNDVCDDQFVTIRWEDNTSDGTGLEGSPTHGQGAKTASFHMVAFTEAVCERRSRIYGTKGEIEADSKTIKVHDFLTGQTKTHHPHQARGGHGGGDDGLARQFVLAIDGVKNKSMKVTDAQTSYIGCTLADIIRSHALVFAAEDARTGKQIVDWLLWWEREVEGRLAGSRPT